MANSIRIVIIHGAYGGPKENWFPWLAESLRRKHCEVLVPTFPTPAGQSLHSWRTAFDEQVGPLSPSTILVGHSLGSAFILRVLERSKSSVMGSFLVSSFATRLGLDEFDSINHSFTDDPFDWDRIRGNAGIVRLYNGDNDPYVPLKLGHDIALRLHGTFVVVQGGGHINKSAGYNEFPQLLADIESLIAGGQRRGP